MQDSAAQKRKNATNNLQIRKLETTTWRMVFTKVAEIRENCSRTEADQT
jgi:hypothetical protein